MRKKGKSRRGKKERKRQEKRTLHCGWALNPGPSVYVQGSNHYKGPNSVIISFSSTNLHNFFNFAKVVNIAIICSM